jgi:hypothetical protein
LEPFSGSISFSCDQSGSQHLRVLYMMGFACALIDLKINE